MTCYALTEVVYKTCCATTSNIGMTIPDPKSQIQWPSENLDVIERGEIQYCVNIAITVHIFRHCRLHSVVEVPQIVV